MSHASVPIMIMNKRTQLKNNIIKDKKIKPSKQQTLKSTIKIIINKLLFFYSINV
jgi:hypothetical protein